MLGMKRHFIGRHLEDRHHGDRQFEISAACHRHGGIVRPLFQVVFGCGNFTYEQPVPLFQRLSSPEIIRLAVLMYVKHPLSLRNVEDLLAERGIDISHETVRDSVGCSRLRSEKDGSRTCAAILTSGSICMRRS
jgi:hypothetical protein